MSCPYAAPLSKEDDGISSVTSSPNAGPSSDDPEVKEALALARSACPAFQNGKGCPFRDATDAETMRLAMLRVPPSHIAGAGVTGGGSDSNSDRNGSENEAGGVDVSSQFQKALQHVHAVSTTLHSPAASAAAPASQSGGFMLEGGCPFKTFYKGKAGSSSVPFVSAMEDFSLGAIIARLADEENMDSDAASASSAESKAVEKGAEATAALPASPAPNASSEDEQHLSISAALQKGTAESHQAAESVHFVKNFVKGIIDRDLYASLVVSLYHVYNVMEEELEKYGPTHFPALHHPTELNRTDSLEDDAEFFHGMGWETTSVGAVSPATRDYVDRLRYIAKTEPLLLLSHAYTRYLGDLSGGKILARVARRALNLKGSKDGLRFYEFELIDNAKRFKDSYRRALDDLKLSPDQVDRLVAEANVAFVLNMRVFEELDFKGGIKGAKVRPLAEATKYYDRCVEEQKQGLRRSSTSTNGEGKCPFAYLGGPNPHANETSETTTTKAHSKPTVVVEDAHEKGGRCPWPFVFCHDPAQGMKDWQTWLVVGLVLSYLWSKMQS